jgi:(1->4)-alpha-D-glucan 1-alpha-D-glucosylmutase
MDSVNDKRSSPRATYRLQFHRNFRLSDALELVPYLSELGVSHVYASPLLRACPGSLHGYDVCDPAQLNPEIGTEADLEALARALRRRDMGLVLDLVPNHMGVGCPENRWWWDVLERGRQSPYAEYFDIDWDSPDPQIRGKVFLPALGDEYERALERGELKVLCERDGIRVGYFEHRFPVSPESRQFGGKSANEAAAELNANRKALDGFLERQHYRLGFWRWGDRKLNYRRFFNIAQLAGVRAEIPEVFAAMHQRALEWHASGWIDGLRVDHPDGLFDPEQYLERLRCAAPAAWIVLEKILMPNEALPSHWPVQGTTGYDFLNRATGLFVDAAGEKAFTRFYGEFAGAPLDYEAVVHEKKRLVLRELFEAEVHRLVPLLDALLGADTGCLRGGGSQTADRVVGFQPPCPPEPRPSGKVPSRFLWDALLELVACFPVYRTYIRPESGVASRADVAQVERAVRLACAKRPDLAECVGWIGEVLLLRNAADRSAPFIRRFQQLTGPAMAKGVEDTAFYCFNRFVALNDVGGNPGQFGGSAGEFHAACVRSRRHWPGSMLATSTHDTKRSEDVRARLALLSEIPDAWAAAVRRWSARLEPCRRGNVPDRNIEYLFYQTLLGAWPLSRERILAFVRKASREAKEHTSWSNPNPAYDQALEGFVTGALADPEFVSDFEKFVAPLIAPGRINSLAQTLLKLAAPGVPDLYQGTELWDLSLVDPDNRRPVDFGLRQRLMREMMSLSVQHIRERTDEGLPKLWLIHRALELRRRRPEWFSETADYEPLPARGLKAGHVVAFCRGGHAVAVAPRLVLGLGSTWGDTALALPAGEWRNELSREAISGGACSVDVLLKDFPVALLSRSS